MLARGVAAYLMKKCDIGSDGKTPTAAEAARPKGHYTDPRIWREDLVHPCQTSKRRNVGTAILSWSIRWNTELFVRSSGCH